MNIYELINRYGRMNEKEPFLPSEAALYLNLLRKANSLHWQMPILCPTSKLCAEINVSKQTLLGAREKLKTRGLIDYAPGHGKVSAPSYTIIGLTDNLTDNLAGNLTDNLTIYNINKYNNINNNNNAREEKLSFEELKQRLSGDAEWLANIHALLSKQYPITRVEVETKLGEFFENLRCQGFNEREGNDCRRYFFYWLKKQLNTNNRNEQHTKRQHDPRRGSAITAKSPKDYEGAF
jgi:hypothetical protein